MITLQLNLTVCYAPNGVSEDELKSMLRSVVDFATSRGLLTGDTPAEVEEYKASVTTVKT